MTGRERIQKAIFHQEPDRVPFDLGGSVVTGIAVSAYQRLVSALGLRERSLKIHSVYSQTAVIDEDVLQILQIDTRPLVIGNPTSWKQEFTEVHGYRYYTDEWQIQYAMPLDGNSGYTAVKMPLAQATTVQEIEKFPWPDGSNPGRFAGLAERAHQLAEVDQVGVILETNIGGLFEWPAWLRGMDNFLIDLASGSNLAQAMIEKITEFKVSFWETALKQAGPYIDLVRESDDLGSQLGLLISPGMYRKYIKPAHTRICETIRKYSQAAICLHSCGSIWDLIPDFIDAGFTVLNPVQLGSAKMDAAALKLMFGHDLTFWGGSIDSQHSLPFLKPEQIREQARKNLEIFAPGGGYIYAPINMITADVPPENILALAQAVLD